MSLPPLPSGDGEPKETGKLKPTKVNSGLPDLDSLEDTYEPITDSAFPDLGDLGEPEPEPDSAFPDLGDLGEPEQTEFEESQDDQESEDVQADFVSESSESAEEDAEFEDLSDGEGDEYEGEIEDDWEGEDGFSFLPTVNYDDEEEEAEEEDDSDFEEEPEPKPKTKPKKDKGFRELDDDSVKEFLDKIKAKFSGLLAKGKKGSDDNEKGPEEKSEEKPEPEEKPKKKGKPSGKINGKKGSSKPQKGKGKRSILPTIIIGTVIAVVVIFGGKSLLGNGYQPLNELTAEVSQENTAILLQNFAPENGIIKLNIVNQGDISADFFMEAEFTEKSILPFNKTVHSCRSDIIAVESGGQVDETLECGDLNPELEYKIDIEIIEIQ